MLLVPKEMIIKEFWSHWKSPSMTSATVWSWCWRKMASSSFLSPKLCVNALKCWHRSWKLKDISSGSIFIAEKWNIGKRQQSSWGKVQNDFWYFPLLKETTGIHSILPRPIALKACAPSPPAPCQLICWSPNPQCGCFWRWALSGSN